MNANLKTIIASALSLVILLVPGLSDVIHEAGGSGAVAAAAVTLTVVIHGVIHYFKGDKPT